jgi:hypothetical protein
MASIATNSCLAKTLPASLSNGNNLNGSSGNVSCILVAKFDYKAKEENELDLRKSERLVLIDNSKNWWLVRKTETDQTG